MEELKNGTYIVHNDCVGFFSICIEPIGAELDLFCPRCMEHLYSIIGNGDSFHFIEYGGKGIELATNWLLRS